MEKAEEKLELITKYFDDFSPAQLQQLQALGPLYRDWNSKINVISRKDEDGLYVKHILHSLSIAAVFDIKKGMQVLDLGTGGGFPGVPLAIFFPDVQFHLVDSIGKKLKVVDAIAAEIGLTNVTTQHTRAEEIRGRKFDVVMSRAVAPLGELWRWSGMVLRKRETSKVKGEKDVGNRETSNVKGERDVRNRETSKVKGERDVGKRETSKVKGERDVKRETSDVRRETSDVRDEGKNVADENRLSLPVPNGLICLKGGDLTKEIAESGCRPRIMEITEIFDEPEFAEKFVLYVPGA